MALAWSRERGLKHVIAYADSSAQHRDIDGLLDDYAFTVIACIDAYEATSDLSYYRFAERIAARMIDYFYDATGSGFYDSSKQALHASLGALAARRKPVQDSPTPAGNPAAVIALLRLHAYSGEKRYREIAQGTLETFAGIAGHFGIFAATYGLAVSLYSQPHTQVAIVGNDETADRLYRAAISPFSISKSLLRFDPDHVVAENLPPSLAATIANLPEVKEKKSVALVCSGFTCQSPVDDADQLRGQLREQTKMPRAS